MGWAQQPAPVVAERARVFYALDNLVIGTSGAVGESTVRRMVDGLVCRVTGTANPIDAWSKIVSPKDRVGIKVSASGRSISGTHPEVALAVAQGLASAGVSPKNIVVWDRNLDDLVAAGYDQSGKYYRLEGIDDRTGYDSESQVSAPVLGKLIWGDSQFGQRTKNMRLADVLSNGDQLSNKSYYAKVLSKEVDKVINIPSLTDSFNTGINGGIVNMTMYNLDNWRRFAKGSSDGDSYLAEVYADPMIHDKVVLTILDALVLQYAGGPFPNPNFTSNYYTIFASRDVVAVDSTAVRLIDEARIANKMPSVRPMAAWLDAANQLGLGQYEEPRIELVRVGVESFR